MPTNNHWPDDYRRADNYNRTNHDEYADDNARSDDVRQHLDLDVRESHDYIINHSPAAIVFGRLRLF